MPYKILADLVMMLHVAFVLFVIGGALFSLKWPRTGWVHIPAAAWGAIVEFTGWPCPLTPIENWLRVQGGQIGYDQDFLAQVFLPLLYPAVLTRDIQLVLGTIVLAVNAGIYAWLGIRAQATKH